MASLAMFTAVSKPKVKSVPDRSLSMVLGTPTTFTPRSASLVATPRVSSPPIATRASTPVLARLSLICSTPPSILNGLVRLEPRMVPPRGRIPRTCGTPSSIVMPSSGPFQPSRNPTNSKPCTPTPLRTTARITAFSPGQSPPPVSTPMRILDTPDSLDQLVGSLQGSRQPRAARSPAVNSRHPVRRVAGDAFGPGADKPGYEVDGASAVEPTGPGSGSATLVTGRPTCGTRRASTWTSASQTTHTANGPAHAASAPRSSSAE